MLRLLRRYYTVLTRGTQLLRMVRMVRMLCSDYSGYSVIMQSLRSGD
jgi:hypothetical protein